MDRMIAQEKATLPGKIAAFLIFISLSELVFKSEQFFYPVIVIMLLWCYFQKKWPLIKKNYCVLMILYMIYSLYSGLWTPTVGIEKFILVKTAVVFTLILQLQFDYTQKDVEILKNTFIFQLLGLLVVTAIWGHIEADGRLWIESAAPVDPNSLSSWLIIPVCIAVDRFFTCSHNALKPLYFSFIFICISLAFLCGSRAGVVSILFCVIVSFIYAMKNTIKYNPGLALSIFIIGIILMGLAFYSMPESVINRFESGNTVELGGRAILWNELINAMELYPANIIIGFGERATEVYSSNHVAHNLFFEALFCQGIIGLTLLLLFILQSFRNAIKKDSYFGIALIGMMIMSSSLSEFTSRPVMLSFFLAGFSCLNKKQGDKVKV